MPYVITTWPECLGCVNPSTDPHHTAPPLSRRAVTTLEEARAEIIKRHNTYGAADRLPESGGTIPLSDGSLIEVVPRSTDSLIAELAAMAVTHGPAGDVDLAVIAAFNAAQARP